MIIIKNIILYFIKIRHTDDFPSTDTRLVHYSTLHEVIKLDNCKHVRYKTVKLITYKRNTSTWEELVYKQHYLKF